MTSAHTTSTPSTLALPSAAALAPKPKLAPFAPSWTDLVEERQLAHVVGLDAAYFEGFTVMREAAGQELSAPNLLADSYIAYLACRRELLRSRLEDQREHREALGKYVSQNRFLLGTTNASDIMSQLPLCVPVASVPTTASTNNALNGSYLSWRRALLALRFERRRAALEEEMCRRFAAEAMEAALAAEAAEATTSAANADSTTQREPQVWRAFAHYDSVLEEEEERLKLAASTWGAPALNRRGYGNSNALGANSGTRAGTGPGGLAAAQHITALSFCARAPDCFAVATEAGTVYLCSALAGVKWATLSGHTATVVAMDWITRGAETLLLTVSEDRSARVWKVALPTLIIPKPVASDSLSTASTHSHPQSLSRSPTESTNGIINNTNGTGANSTAAGASNVASVVSNTNAGRPPSTPTRSHPTRSRSETPRSAGAKARQLRQQLQQQLELSPNGNMSSSSASGNLPSVVTPAKGGYLEPAERAVELERARARMLEEEIRERNLREAARGPVVSGGGAYCVRTIHFDAPVTHAAWLPVHPTLFVCASAEETDLDLEAEATAAEMEARYGGANGTGAGAAGGEYGAQAYDTNASGVGGMLRKGLAGGFGAMKDGMKAVGKTTLSAIEAVPVVGGAAKITAALAKAAVTGDLALLPRRRERRGTLLVINALSGKAIQTRLVRGTLGASLIKPHSYVTALAFSTSGHQLFVGDARGLIHEYTIETDPQDAQFKPLKDHQVIFGEGNNVFAAMAGVDSGNEAESSLSWLASHASGLLDRSHSTPWSPFGSSGAGTGMNADDNPNSNNTDSTPSVSAPTTTHLISLFYRPYDSALRSPLLIGLDNHHRIRALSVPPPTTATEQHWRAGQPAGGGSETNGGRDAIKSRGRTKDSTSAMAAAAAKTGARVAVGAAVGAMNAVTNATVTAVTLGKVSGDKLAVNVNLGVPQATELRDFLVYTAMGAPASMVAGGNGGANATSLRPSSSSHTGGGASGQRGSTQFAAGNTTGHSVIIPCRLTDALLGGGKAGDIYLFNPHAAPGSGAGSGGMFGDLAIGGRDAAVGAGVVAAQVIARLSGPHPYNTTVTLLAINRDETVIVSADASGGLVAWKKVPLSIAEAEDSTWSAAGRPTLSSLGLASPGGGGGISSSIESGMGGRPGSVRLAAIFDAHAVHSVGRIAAEEARRLALGHLGGHKPPVSSGGGASTFGASASVGHAATSSRARAGLPAAWSSSHASGGGGNR